MLTGYTCSHLSGLRLVFAEISKRFPDAFCVYLSSVLFKWDHKPNSMLPQCRRRVRQKLEVSSGEVNSLLLKSQPNLVSDTGDE